MKLILAIACILVSYSAAAQIEVHGHRGARALFPENTLPAFQHALEVGVDVIELDMAVSKDDKVVVNHDLVIDTNICKYTNDLKPVIELSLKEIKAIDCGSLANPRFPKQKRIPGTKIPTLDEVFQLVTTSKLPAAKKVKFNIETKSNELFPHLTPSPDKYVRLVNDLIQKYKLEDRVILQSFDIRTLKAMRKLNPKIKLSFLNFEVDDIFSSFAELLKVQINTPYHKQLPEKNTAQLQEKGMKVIPWTANTEEDWDRLIKMKVDGIITDNPQHLIRYLKMKGLR